ncbi:hypothetical protein EYZ11_002574 [Aspergillus tanneri]|uniref:Uncharacterized protein n=1 Tax=Aspergillus tanneri TaxID=1220188 RepID=A0A4S3JSS3_9EURO|nr:hypothetical protein EYZ11_002574 [Aspergillus tanneri]
MSDWGTIGSKFDCASAELAQASSCRILS